MAYHNKRGRPRRKKKTPGIVRAHFLRRFNERYGDISNEEILLMERAIKEGDADLVFIESLSRKHYNVPHNGGTARVVYNTRLKALTTALPKGDDHG